MVRMHPSASKDPRIAHPLPLPSLTFSVAHTLHSCGIQAETREIISRVMRGKPRVAIFTGTPDEPTFASDSGLARAVAAVLWERGMLPFWLAIPSLPSGPAAGHGAMRYDLMSRNVTTAMVLAYIETYGFDAAVSIPSGSLRPVAELAAYVETDVRRKNARQPSFSCVMLPSPVPPEGEVPPEVREKLAQVKEKIDRPLLVQHVERLLGQRLRLNMYPVFYKVLEQLVAKRVLTRTECDELLFSLAKSLGQGPLPPACMEDTFSLRVVLYGLGLVPSGLELLASQPTAGQLASALNPFLKAIATRKETPGVASLVEANLENAIRLWSCLNGSTDWALHFQYVASFMELPEDRLPTPTYLAALCAETPSLGVFPPDGEPSLAQWAADIASGRVGGLDTVMATLRRLDPAMVKDGPTVDAPWSKRLAHAKPADGTYVSAEPRSECSGIVELRGNFCESSVLRIAGMSQDDLQRFDKKTYLAVFYYNEEDALADLLDSSKILDKVKTIVTMDDLLSLFSLNYPDRLDEYKVYAKLKKDELFDRLVDHELMRIIVIIAGEGPVASGMRQIYYPCEYVRWDARLRNICVVCTDGRLPGTAWGPFIGHCAPEAVEGGGISALETGELVYVDFENGIINALDKDSSFDMGKIVLLSKNEIQRRPLGSARQRKMSEDRLHIPLALRSLLNSCTPTTSGVGPYVGR